MSDIANPEWLADVDELVRQGDLTEAAARLEGAISGVSAQPSLWLKLAGLRRALRQPRRALDAVHIALSAEPLDFMALVMRAALLDRIKDGEAGLAWEQALAQRPAGDLHPALAAAVAAGEATHTAWKATRAAQLIAATTNIECRASEDEARRITRFRSNILRQSRPYHSEPTHFHFPELVEREFHPRGDFGWIEGLEAATNDIRAEMLAAIASGGSQSKPYIQYQEHEALAQWRALNNNDDWTAIHLQSHGRRVEANAELCPLTMALLEKFAQPSIVGASPNAMFSLLAPNTKIPPHVGVSNARLVCHLPLIVPDGCWFRVGGETRLWREGEAFVFDDTIEHEAVNPTDQLRIVLIFDIWHPGLSSVERDAVASLIAAEAGNADLAL